MRQIMEEREKNRVDFYEHAPRNFVMNPRRPESTELWLAYGAVDTIAKIKEICKVRKDIEEHTVCLAERIGEVSACAIPLFNTLRMSDFARRHNYEICKELVVRDGKERLGNYFKAQSSKL